MKSHWTQQLCIPFARAHTITVFYRHIALETHLLDKYENGTIFYIPLT